MQDVKKYLTNDPLFRIAFDSAPIGMALVELRGHFLAVNQSLADLLGYPIDLLLRKTFQDITHPDDLDADLTLVQKALAGEIQDYQLEKRYLHQRGNQVWAMLNVTLVKDEANKPLFFISQIQDISARKQTEALLERLNETSLWESEERYRVLFDASFDAVVLYVEGEIFEVNQSFLTLFGYERHDVIGKNATDMYVMPESMSEVNERLRSNSEEVYEAVLKRKDGSSFSAEIRAKTTPYQGRLVRTASVRDITVVKEAQARDTYLATVLENISDAIISTDLEFRIRSWNKGAELLYGWKAEEVMGQPFTEVVQTRRVDENRGDAVNQLGSSGYWKGEVVQYHRDGTPIYVLNATILITDDRDQPKGVVAANRDISERKRIEEKLRRDALHDPLTGLINRAALMDRLKQASERAKRFPESVNHRNPILSY